MTINKNFVVRNGLEVAQTLLCADDETNKVGINSANPGFELDLYGDLRITGGLSVGGTTGRPGEYLESTGDALEWKAIPVLRVVETYTAVSGQVTFPSTGFLPYAAADFIDVFVDGVKLAQDEYTPSTGNTRIELVAPALAGETIELVAYNASSIGVGGSGIQGITIGEEGVVVGTAGQVTNLNFVGASLTAIGSGAGVTVYFDNVVPGIATYASFSGIATYAETSRVTIKDSGSTIGIAGTIDFGDNLTVSALSAGIVTITAAASGGTSSQWETTAAGIHTLSNVGVGTTNPTSALTVKGNTSLETLDISGISTFNSQVDFYGTIQLKTTTDADVFSISYDSASDDISFRFDQTGGTGGSEVQYLLKDNATFKIRNINTAGTIANFTANGNNELYYDDSKKFETLGAGVTVTGTTFTDQLSVSGVSTFSGTINANNVGAGISVKLSNSVPTYLEMLGVGNYNATLKNIYDSNSSILVHSGAVELRSGGTNNYSVFNGTIDGTGQLMYRSGAKLSSLIDGVEVNGTTFTDNLSVGTSGTTITTSSGNVGVGTTNPTSTLTVRGGDISVGVNTAHGVILTSPNGTQYRLIVDDSGNLSTVSV